MKFLSVLLLVVTAGQLAIAAGAAKPAGKPASTVLEKTKLLKLDAATVGRGKAVNKALLAKNIKEAMPQLVKMGSTEAKIQSVLTFNPAFIDVVVKASESSDQNFKDLVSRLLDLYEAKSSEIDVNSNESIQMGKLAALLALDKVPAEYMKFATEVANKMQQDGVTAEQAVKSSAAEYAAKKTINGRKMTTEEWLEKFKECIG